MSHLPIDMPARRAASRAVSRACGLTPLTCQGKPDFMPASDASREKQGRMALAEPALINKGWKATRPCVLGGQFFPLEVNRQLSPGNAGTRFLRWSFDVAI